MSLNDLHVHHVHHVRSSSRTYSPPASRTKRVVFWGGGLRQIDRIVEGPNMLVVAVCRLPRRWFWWRTESWQQIVPSWFFEGFHWLQIAVPVLQLLHMPRTVIWRRIYNATMLHKRTWRAEVEDFKRPQVHRAVSDPQHDSLTAVPFEETWMSKIP